MHGTDQTADDAVPRRKHALQLCWASTLVGWACLFQGLRYAGTVHHVRAVLANQCGSHGFASKLLEVTHDSAPAVTCLMIGLMIVLGASAGQVTIAIRRHRSGALARHLGLVAAALVTALALVLVFTEILLAYHPGRRIEPFVLGPEYDAVIGPWGLDPLLWMTLALAAGGLMLSIVARVAPVRGRWGTASLAVLLVVTAPASQAIFNHTYACAIDFGSYFDLWRRVAPACLAVPTLAWLGFLASRRASLR